MAGFELLSREYITENARPLKRQPAIYFLLSNGEIVYIGRSSNLPARIGDHISKPGMPCDAYFAVHCPAKDLDATEAAYIQRYQPACNRRENKGYQVDKHCDAILDAVPGTRKKLKAALGQVTCASAGLTAPTTASSC